LDEEETKVEKKIKIDMPVSVLDKLTGFKN